MLQLDIIKDKIMPLDQLLKVSSAWKFLGEKVVFTNGCFDIMHLGHVDYLSKAKDLGDRLIVAVNKDASVKKLKGENRPLNDEEARSVMMASLHFVDAVILFGEDTPIDLITAIRPDVLAKGADYTIETVVGHEIVQGYGGQVKLIDFLEGYSTTRLIDDIRNGKG